MATKAEVEAATEAAKACIQADDDVRNLSSFTLERAVLAALEAAEKVRPPVFLGMDFGKTPSFTIYEPS